MRIANKTLFDGVIRNLGRTSADMFNAQEIVTTTKKINKLSDDPVGLVSVLDLRSSLSNIQQMERNISMGKSWLSAGESALTQTDEILSLAKQLCIQMANDSVGPTERANSLNIVDGYLKQVISLANSQSGGRYMFGGTNTDTSPFALDSGETQVDYYGNENPFSIKIGTNSNVAIGKDGAGIFGENWDDNNFFKTFIDLKTYLQTNDLSGIQNTLTKLDSHMDTVNSAISDIAGKSIRLEVKENIIADLELSYTERKSEIEDADLAEAIISLKAKELAYNASLASSSKIMELSLVNYI